MNAAATAEAEAQAADPPARKAAKARPAANSAAATAAPRPVIHFSPATLELAEQVYNRWRVVAPLGLAPEDLDLRSEPFALIADTLHKFDDIRVVAADNAWFADLVVVDKGEGYAIARMAQVIALPQARKDLTNRIPDGFEVRPAAAGDVQPGWLAVRQSDGVILNVGHSFERREDATRFLLDHASVRGQTPQSVFRSLS